MDSLTISPLDSFTASPLALYGLSHYLPSRFVHYLSLGVIWTPLLHTFHLDYPTAFLGFIWTHCFYHAVIWTPLDPYYTLSKLIQAYS